MKNIRLNNEQLNTLCDKVIAEAKKENASWAEKFQNNPSHALEWADRTFTMTAKLNVYTEVKEALKADRSSQQIADFLQEAVINSARFQAKTSSTSDGYLSRCVLAAKAELYELITVGV